MPFITEEIYHLLKDQQDDLCVRQFKADYGNPDRHLQEQGALLQNAISSIRNARNKNQLKPKDPVKLYIETGVQNSYEVILSILSKQVNAESIAFVNEMPPNTIVIAEGKDKFYLETKQAFNTENQKDALLKELKYLEGFLISVDKKLGNERFVQQAKPDVIELERKKRADAEAKIKVIEESLADLF